MDPASGRSPGVAMRITENGIATGNGERRAQSIVKHLIEVAALFDENIALESYIHWALTDHFEWADAWTQQFGLYAVDRETFERIETTGADIYREIVADHGIRRSLIRRYDRPMMAE